MLYARITPTDRTFRAHRIPGTLANDPAIEIHKRNRRYIRQEYLGQNCVGWRKITKQEVDRLLQFARDTECVVEVQP